MGNENLKKTLHYNYYCREGYPYWATTQLGCFEQAVASIVKSKFWNTVNSYYVFLNDIVFCISQHLDSGIINDIYINYIRLDESLYKVNVFGENGEATISVLESLLDKGELVIVQTVVQMLKFLTYYTPEFDIKQFKPAHVFLAIYHDEQNIYYVDNEALLNRSYFIPYEENPSVGVISKKEFADACKHYLRCFTVTFNNERLSKIDSRFPNIITKAVDNYYSEITDLGDGSQLFCGREAIKRFISFCEGEHLHIKSSLLNKLTTKFSQGFGKRIFMRECLESYFNGFNEIDLVSLKNLFEDDIIAWINIRNSITKKLVSGKYPFDSGLKKHFYKALMVEDKLFNYLKEVVGTLKTIGKFGNGS